MTGTPPEDQARDQQGEQLGIPEGTVQTDLDQLLNVAIDVAQQLLDEADGFLPFAVGLTDDGEAQLLMVEDEETDGEEALETLVEAITENREVLVGAAIVTDVLFDDDKDAVRVEIEHREPVVSALTMMLPYTASDTGYDYGDLLGLETERRFWA